MPQTVELSSETMEMIESISESTNKETSEIIRESVILYAESKLTFKGPNKGKLVLGPDNTEKVVYSRPLSIFIGDESHDCSSWSEAVKIVYSFFKDKDLDRDKFTFKIIDDNLDESRYIYLDKEDVSISRLSSHHICDKILDLGRDLGIDIKIEVEWRDKKGAPYPGAKGIVRSGD